MPDEDDLRVVLRLAARDAPAGALPTAASLTETRQKPRRPQGQRFSAAVAAGAVVAIIVVVSLVQRHDQTSSASSGHATPTAAASAPTTATPTKAGPVEVSLVVDHTSAHRGQPITGRLEITNTTGASILIRVSPTPGCSSSLPSIEVGLANASVKFEPPSLTVLCSHFYELVPGRTALPMTIATTTTFTAECKTAGCVQPSFPPLPEGLYQTAIVLPDFPAGTVLPPPVNITVIN